MRGCGRVGTAYHAASRRCFRRPSLQACSNTMPPSAASMCSTIWMAAFERTAWVGVMPNLRDFRPPGALARPLRGQYGSPHGNPEDPRRGRSRVASLLRLSMAPRAIAGPGWSSLVHSAIDLKPTRPHAIRAAAWRGSVGRPFASRVWMWPKAAELSDATGRQQCGVHRTCCQLAATAALEEVNRNHQQGALGGRKLSHRPRPWLLTVRTNWMAH
jgi:hypothetical protein